MVFCNIIHGINQNYYTCHNPYFNRWFSAMQSVINNDKQALCHNPYFNRWFSAIIDKVIEDNTERESQSLF